MTYYTQLDGAPVRLDTRPFGGFAVHATDTLGRPVHYLGDLRECAVAGGPGGRGFRIENDGQRHRHTYLLTAPDGGVVERDVPVDCLCGGPLSSQTFHGADEGALALLNHWLATKDVEHVEATEVEV